MNPLKFRKKPVEIEAMQYVDSSEQEIAKWVGSDLSKSSPTTLNIHTLEGTMTASLGDWIIKGVNGEFYPCKPDIFEKTYEAV